MTPKSLLIGIVLFGLGAGSALLLRGQVSTDASGSEAAAGGPRDASGRQDIPDVPAETPGRWRRAPGGDDAGAGDLADLGYAEGSEPGTGASGVTKFLPELAEPGLNLCVDGASPSASLLDMQGNLLHTWSLELAAVLGQKRIDRTLEREGALPDKYGYWRRVHPFANGDLLAIFVDEALVKLDKDSNLLWSWKGAPHHDLDVDEASGRIWLLTRRAHIVPQYSKDRDTIEDYITVLSPEGKKVREFSLLKALENSEYHSLALELSRGGDVMHTNTIELLDGSLAEVAPAFARGNVLVSFCNTDVIAIVDPKLKSVVWAMTGMWHRQHQPTLLANGHMLVLDNRGFEKHSKVIEFDPLTRQVTWAYRNSVAHPFSTRTCGSNARLANGNTLITETDSGRAFEVRPGGRIVWEYFTPHRAGPSGEFIASLFDVLRLEPDYGADWLEPQDE
jgi:hypothetical protein